MNTAIDHTLKWNHPCFRCFRLQSKSKKIKLQNIFQFLLRKNDILLFLYVNRTTEASYFMHQNRQT